MRISLKEQFLVDKNGEAKSIVLDIADFQKLIRLIEDLEDTLDLKHAIETSTGFISHAKLTKRLKQEKLL